MAGRGDFAREAGKRGGGEAGKRGSGEAGEEAGSGFLAIICVILVRCLIVFAAILDNGQEAV